MVATATATASPPASVEVYDFSYSRSTGKMRFELDGQKWLVSRIAGKVESVGVNHEGKWQVRCKLAVQDDSAFVYAPKDVEPPVLPEVTIDSHIRLCYNRAGSEKDKRPHWRLRDERTQHLYSNDVRDYKGIVNLNWMDGGPHVFHDGPVFLDEKGTAWFAPVA